MTSSGYMVSSMSESQARKDALKQEVEETVIQM